MGKPKPAPGSQPKYEFDYTATFVSQIKEAPQEVVEETLKRIEGISGFPFPGTSLLGVKQYKETDLGPDAYTAGFPIKNGGGLLIFQVFEVLRTIRLVELIWTDPTIEPPGAPGQLTST